ncbi:TIGR03756 family integrating conjugative element protein [Ectothiorhodospira shaposhnikovii]|nr:TIGR03756 family integrating conjugative element protein [Ectothiorhodospira shaposhnikovii]
MARSICPGRLNTIKGGAMNGKRRGILTLSVLAGMVMMPVHTAAESINSATIAARTAAGTLSCVRWQPLGVCFWLSCGLSGCSIRTSLKVGHYAPDLVVGVYRQLGETPWVEVRNSLGLTSDVAARQLVQQLAGIQPGGGQGTERRAARDHSTLLYKEADAYGHPTGLSGLVSLVNDGAGLSWIENHINTGFDFQNEWDEENQMFLETVDPAEAAAEAQSRVQNLGAGTIGQLQGMFNQTISLLCPRIPSLAAQYFHSGLDAVAWRWSLPESLYPQALTPGSRELGVFPLYTWGSIYPRDGFVLQTDDAKAAALVAQRVGDVVTRSGQPHVYRYLQSGGAGNHDGFRVWYPAPLMERDSKTGDWQMLTPRTDSGCQVFGQNDLNQAASWGVGRIAGPTEGNYAWNLWRPYSCCSRHGSWIGEITWSSYP